MDPVGTLLAAAGGRINRLDAELLMAHVLGKPRTWIIAHKEHVPSPCLSRQFHVLVRRRADGVPFALLVGRQEFWSLDLEVTPDTLIPRPETELLVTLALTFDDHPRSVLDPGTGSGAIAAALAVERPTWRIFASDISAPALGVARRNVPTTTNLFCGNWLAAVRGSSLDLVICNPPYLADDDPHLSTLSFEPRTALVADNQGLADFDTIAADLHRVLKPGGAIIVEHGMSQGAQLRLLFRDEGFDNISTHTDLAGHERATMAFWQKPLQDSNHG